MRRLFLVVLAVAGIVLAVQAVRTKLDRQDTTATGDRFYNAFTGRHYSGGDQAKALESIEDEKARGRERGYLKDCEVQGRTVVATAGPSFGGWYTRADRERLLDTLLRDYSALEEVSHVEIRTPDGTVLATYTQAGGYSDR